ncbi:alpha/beta hydrolase family protein [Geodermatophilus sp. SYSU D00697]
MQLHRDNQQWVFDWVVKETGRVFHFQGDGRGGLPPAVRSHDMISKHVGRRGLRLLAMAEREEAAGHPTTALELAFDAATALAAAQHTVLRTDDEKRALHAASLRAYERVRRLAPYRIERVVVPYDGVTAAGWLHLHPGVDRAPCVVVVPGCDMTKEMYPHPLWNQAHQRGLHVLVIDGPGQGESNTAGVRLTADNYPRAVSAFLDALCSRPDVDAGALLLFGLSFGSLWALQSAASDDRIAACVAAWASVGDLRHLMEEESPRYKRLFAYLTQSSSEEELDEVVAAMALGERAREITCPVLLAVGEYDPRSPLEEVYEVFDALAGPRELWVFEDQHHACSITGRPLVESAMWGHDTPAWAMDWLADRVAGRAPACPGQVLRLSPTGLGPHGPTPTTARSWYEELGVDHG